MDRPGDATTTSVTSEWVRTAHGDAWEELGRQRIPIGGEIHRLPGIRLMASGTPYGQWNGGHVDDPALIDIDAVRSWYAPRCAAWGVRVAVGSEWPYGRRLLGLRLMGMTAPEFSPASLPPDVSLGAAGPDDVNDVLAIDTVAFEETVEVERTWMEPLLSQLPVSVALARHAGEPVGTGYSVLSRGGAGTCLYVAGIAVLPEARRRGIGAALSSWLVAKGVASGAEMIHLHPDTDAAAALYQRLGFREVEALDVYVDI
jgi:GNAT superfamily N-acetyltransferase